MKQNEAKVVCLGFFSGPHDTVQCSFRVKSIECEEDSRWAVTIYPGIGSLGLVFVFMVFLGFFHLFLHLGFLETIQIVLASSIFLWDVSFADLK